MNQKWCRIAAFFCSLLFAVLIITVPALATGGEPVTYNNDNSGIVVFPTENAPPTPSPTPAPTPTPAPEPTPEPTPVPQTPTPDNNNNDNNGGNQGNGTISAATPRPTVKPATPSPSAVPTPQSTPAAPPVVQRPTVTLRPSSAPEETEKTHNYVTFAKLNKKNNTLAVTLFYGGTGLTVLGSIGLVSIVFMVLRNRRKDSREIIFREIREAENRQPHPISSTPELMVSPGHSQAIGNDPAGSRAPRQRSSSDQSRPPRERRNYETLPSREELSSGAAGLSRAEPEKNRANAPIVPVAASIYTEEFSLAEQSESAPVRPMASRLRQTAHTPKSEEEQPQKPVQKETPPQHEPAPAAKTPSGPALTEGRTPPRTPKAGPEKPEKTPERKAEPTAKQKGAPKAEPPTQTLPTLEIPNVKAVAKKTASPAVRPQPMPEETIEWTAERAKPEPASQKPAPKKPAHKVSSISIPEDALPAGKSKKKAASQPEYEQESLFDNSPAAAQPEPQPAESEELPGQLNLF